MNYLIAILILLSGCANAQASRAAEQAVGTHGKVGPQAQTVPAGAVVARDGAELARLLADPQGPRDIWLGNVTYEGDFVVQRPLNLHGSGGTVLQGSGRGVVLDLKGNDISVSDVSLRNTGSKNSREDTGIRAQGKGIAISRVDIDQTLFGISLQMCHSCTIDSVHVRGRSGPPENRGDGIKLWESNDSAVRNSEIAGTRDLVIWYSRRVILENNYVHDGRYGTHFMYAHDTVVRNSRIVNNIVGIFVMYSARMRVEGNVLAGARGAAGIGLGFKDSDGVQVSANRIIGNTTGIYLDQTPRSPDQPVMLQGNEIALDGVALRLHGASDGVHLRANDWKDNGELVTVEGGGDALAIRCDGNFWSDYAGYDLDGDGTGDVAFEAIKLTSDLTDQHPQIKWYGATAAMGLLDTVARAMPLLANDKMLVDAQPALLPHRDRL